MRSNDINFWDFKNNKTSEFTHGLHSYPARMVPGVAKELILLFSKKGDLIYDPFSGSGTTLVEGTLMKRKVIGIDLNPFAVLLSKVKTTPIFPNYLEMEWNYLERRLVNSSPLERMKEFHKSDGKILDLKFWYKPFVLRDLNFIRSTIYELFPIVNDPTQNFMKIIFARTAREVSNQRQREFKRWRIPSEEILTFRPSPIKIFINFGQKALESMNSYYQETGGRTSSRVYLKDARTFNIHNKASLIVTSPPYGDSGTTVAYGQFSSFALEWLEMYEKDPRELDSAKLGNSHPGIDSLEISEHLRNTYKKLSRIDTSRAEYLLQYFDGMEQALLNMKASLKDRGLLCLVLGNRRIRGLQIPTDVIIREQALNIGFVLEETFKRKILNKRMPYVTSNLNNLGTRYTQATMDSETILVLRLS